MKSRFPVKPFLYLAFTVAFFASLVVLDRVFGFHYEPIDHDLAKEVNEEPELVDDLAYGHQEADTMQSTGHTSIVSETASSEETTQEETKKPANKEAKLATTESTSTKSYFEKLLATYREEVVAKLDKNKARQDIVIRYYHHAPDGNSAYTLAKLGYYIHEREVAAEYLDYQSNAIFYGDSVDLKDLQIVSYVLINNGLPIKEITPSKFHDSWKAHAIEIGTDTTMLNQPSITLDQVRALSL
ncbi:hypothetical protein [Marinoscillum sp.]|uniref:hypothetical protein n=1 Tax=Marinoscillum sp. TaxID=2024838 RepID=UPI003BABC698